MKCNISIICIALFTCPLTTANGQLTIIPASQLGNEPHKVLKPYNIPWSEHARTDRRCFCKQECHLVLLLSGKPIGYCGYWHLGKHGYIEYLSISQQHQNSGLGSTLLEAACEKLGDVGATSVWLKPTERAIPFYERHDFRWVTLLRIPIAYMQRTLAPESWHRYVPNRETPTI